IPYVVAEALDAHVPDLGAVSGHDLDARDGDAALPTAVGGDLLYERHAAAALRDHDGAEHDRPGAGGPVLLHVQRQLHLDAGRHARPAGAEAGGAATPPPRRWANPRGGPSPARPAATRGASRARSADAKAARPRSGRAAAVPWVRARPPLPDGALHLQRDEAV